MFLRLKWFGIAFGSLAVNLMYDYACYVMRLGYSGVHPTLVAISLASAVVCLLCSDEAGKSGHENLAFLSCCTLILGGMGPLLFMSPGRDIPIHKIAYSFPSGGDWFLGGVIAFNLILALLMVFARVPKGKMLVVGGRVFYGGARPIFVPWFRYKVEKPDEIPVKVEFHCAAGTSIVCEAVLQPDVEWCRTNGVACVDVANFRETAAQILKRTIANRAELRDVSWLSSGEVFESLASLNPAALADTAAGVRFRCLKITAAASVTIAA